MRQSNAYIMRDQIRERVSLVMEERRRQSAAPLALSKYMLMSAALTVSYLLGLAATG